MSCSHTNALSKMTVLLLMKRTAFPQIIIYKSLDGENSGKFEYVGIELFVFVSEGRKKLIFEGAISLQLMLRNCKKDSGIINFNGPSQSGSGELIVKKNGKELTCQLKFIEIEWMDLIRKLFG